MLQAQTFHTGMHMTTSQFYLSNTLCAAAILNAIYLYNLRYKFKMQVFLVIYNYYSFLCVVDTTGER